MKKQGRLSPIEKQLRQIIMNLVKQACDSMPRGGTLTIATAERAVNEVSASQHNVPAGNYVEVIVRDTGTGLDPATQAHIFEPFYSTKQSAKGTGLRLASVYGMVEQSEGLIEVWSQRGMGSSFTICLPRCDQIQPTRSAVRQSDRPRGHETILLVEDDEDVRIVVGDMLRAAGYRVLEASDGAQALQMLYADMDPLDLVLTDVVMPRMTGPQRVQQMESLAPKAKVLYMSG